MRSTHPTVAILGMMVVAGAALAQAVPPPQHPPPQQPSPGDPKRTIPEKMAPPEKGIPERNDQKGGTAAPSNGEAGKGLGPSKDGVIRPPTNMDREIYVPAPVPDPGTTKVIPPPGTPGNPSPIQPK